MALPSEFSALEPYLAWDLATEPERYAKRLASTMAQMQEFYDVAFPLLNDVIAYCDQYPLDDLPDDAKNSCTSCSRWSWCPSRSRHGNSHASPTAARRGLKCSGSR